MSRTSWIKVAAFVALLGAALAYQLIVGLPSQDELRSALDDLGLAAIPAFIGLYVVVSLLPVGPSGVLSVVGGALLGFPVALASVLVAAVIAASIGFAVGRTLGRDAVRGLSNERISALDRRFSEHGFPAVLLARMVPLIPFTTLNYACGLTALTFRPYLLATALGIVPGTATYVAVGAYGADPTSWPFLLAVGALILLTVLGILRSRRQSASASADVPGPDPR